MKAHLSAIIYAVAIVIATLLLGGAWKKSHPTHQSITVTGLANENFTSDLIVWNTSYTEKAMDLKEAYAKIKHDAEIVRQYLLSKGVRQQDIVVGSTDIQKLWKTTYSGEGNSRESAQVFDGYQLTQSVKVASNEVDKVEAISREVTELINQGVELYSDQPSYFYTKLADLKIKMLANASADARNRAEKIADKAQASLGKLQDASMGIFQITGQNSNEEFSGGGAFNTSSKAKTASITVRLEFGVD